MSKAAYMTRRDGRYQLQIRNSKLLAALLGQPLFRTSLSTSNYREAKARLELILSWVFRLNAVNTIDELNAEVSALIDLHYIGFCAENTDNRYSWDVFRKKVGVFVEKRLCQDDVFWKINSVFSEKSSKNAFVTDQNADLLLSNAHKGSFANNLPGEIQPNDITISDFSRSIKLFGANGTNPEVSALSQFRSSTVTGAKLSEVLQLFRAEFMLSKSSVSLRKDTELLIQFAIEEFHDPYVSEWSDDDIASFGKMLADVPNREGIPREFNTSLSMRYRYAANHGWDGLKRLTEKRIRDGYHVCLHKFFDWMIVKGYFNRPRPVFNFVSSENLVSLQRDAFSDSEIIDIVSQPLFTGCNGKTRIWVKGSYFIQNHLYWAFLISIFTGLRPGEVGRLETSDFIEKDGIWFLQIRGFDPTKGRVARKDVKKFKTKSSERLVPLHPIILDLGFLDRLEKLQNIGCPVVFPEWEPYLPKGGNPQWGRPTTKSWDYLKRKMNLTRKDISLYSTRHFFAHMIDNTDLTHLARKKVMGHSDKSDMASRYGAKARFTTKDLAVLRNVRNPIIDQITTILLDAKRRADNKELIRVEYFQNPHSWSEYYRSKIKKRDFQSEVN